MTRDREQDWADWLKAANQGDRQAYVRLLEDVTPVIRGIVRARGGWLGLEACEDVVQEVLLALHAKRHTWREAEPVQPWLYAIARHKVVDAVRARGGRVSLPIEDFADVLPAPNALDPTLRSDALRMISELDERSARIVRAIGLEGASVSETGAELGMKEGAVRVALHRSLKKLANLRGRMIE